MGRSTEELENILKDIINSSKKEKVSSLPKERTNVLVPLNKKQTRMLSQRDVKHVKSDVKSMLSTEALLGEMLSGKKPIQIAREHGISRSAVTQRLKNLKSKNLVWKKGKEWHVKSDVKVLSLGTTPSKKLYEFQTIQIIIPLKNPNQYDLIKWDKIVPEMRQSYKKYKHFKFTLNKTTRSVRLFLHKRYIIYPEQVKEICKAYVNWSASQFKEYDIILDTTKARAVGLHLWGHDKKVGESYKKDMGMIGVKHGVPSEKIFPHDKEVERDTWIDSTPSPDGIESKDFSYFNDKKGMELFVGKPTEEELREYMLKPTEFMAAMGGLAKGINEDTVARKEDTQARYLEIYNKQLHQGILVDMKDTLKLIQVNLSGIKLEDVDVNNIKEDDQLTCTRCGKVSYAKAIVNKDFTCPHCYFNLRLVYPYLVQNKSKFKPNIDI